MSFLSETVLAGSTRLYIAGGADAASKDVRTTQGKNQSHGGLFTPLIQLVRDPVGTIAGAVGNLSPVSEIDIPDDSTIDRTQVLYLRMRNAKSYEEWKSAATELDTLEGNDTWKLEVESHEYDAALITARLKQLEDARTDCDVKKMLFLIRTSLTRGLGGMGDLRLYKHSHIGTKALIENYIDSAQKTMQALFEVSARQGDSCPVEPRDLMDSLLATRQSFGRSALLLSGGGTFGMNHVGVVGCLWKARLLPRIISGASAGSIVCAVLCTKTDAEIPDVLEEFCYGDLAVFEREGEEDGIMKKAARFLKYGALFDITHLMNVMRKMLGDITFQESYNRTRRILNITVSSASLYELPRLLNYVTAPNVMIWSAVCASCSVPFVFSPASLLAKDPKTGKEVPWNPTPNAGWIDGSVDNDLPMTRLAEMFNVNHFIVSQVNPHVVPFLAKEDELIGAEAQQDPAFSAGPTWIHHMANLAKGEALHRLQVLSELGIFPNYLTKARSVLNQRYSGDITIFPSISYAHFPKVLSNPTTEYMLQCTLTGERATWPKLSRVKNHVAIELALDETIRKFRTQIVFSNSQVNLRLNSFSRPLSQGNTISSRYKASNKTTPSIPFISSTPPTISRRSQHLQIKYPAKPARAVRPYLPSLLSQKQSRYETSKSLDHFSSSTNPDGSSSDEAFAGDSDTSELFSSPSPPNSPSSQQPTLWPSTRQLFPSASQSAGPSVGSSLYGYRNSSFFNLAMTAPSSPELRYKRLFHPPEKAADPVHPSANPQVLRAVENTVSPVGNMDFTTPTLQHTNSNPEAQKVPPPAMARTDSFPETKMRELGMLPSASPPLTSVQPVPIDDVQATANDTLKKLSRKEKKEAREVERERRSLSRRGSAQGSGIGLLLDISGTRGMLRRKKSAIFGSSNSQA